VCKALRLRGRRLARALELALAAIGASLIALHLSFGTLEVVGENMAPTLQGGAACEPGNDVVLYERLSLSLTPPPRQRLLVYQGDEGLTVARRVVALAGERVRVVEGRLEADGTPLALPEGVTSYLAAGHLRRPDGSAWPVPEGQVLVLGDQPGDIWDGRFCGGLPADRWAGRAVCVVWPPARWRWLW